MHLHITFHLMGASELDTVVSVSAVALAPTDRSKQYPRQSLQRLSFHPAFFNLQPVGQLGSTSRIHTACERESHLLGLFFLSFPSHPAPVFGISAPFAFGVCVSLGFINHWHLRVSTLEEYLVRIQHSVQMHFKDNLWILWKGKLYPPLIITGLHSNCHPVFISSSVASYLLSMGSAHMLKVYQRRNLSQHRDSFVLYVQVLAMSCPKQWPELSIHTHCSQTFLAF